MASIAKTKLMMRAMYGKNREITGDYSEKLAVTCINGTFVGKKDGDVISYKGIPFALPPTGERRWKKPEPVTYDDGVYQAYYFGPSPIQTEIASERASLYVQSEDCLYLNIWVNDFNKSKNKPVLVFIHGGSYGWGGTSDPLYEGSNLIRKFDDVILVTIAYRTGIMGFMDFSFVKGGEDFPDSCNLGLLDQIEALRWVKANIEGFGGDPENITIAGESAGAGSVSLLPIMPAANGLFKRVIAESGSVALSFSREECRPLTEKLMDGAGTHSMKGLMKLSTEELMELNIPLNDFNNFPMRDGRIVPEDVYGTYENGGGCKVDMLIGTNADECRYWIGEIGGITKYTLSIPILYENNIRRISEEDMNYVNAFLDSQFGKDVWKYTQFYNEILFRVPALEQAIHHANCGGDTYVYYWDYPSSIKNYGACHAVELAYVFNNLTETIYTGNNIKVELADEVQNMWMNFVRGGDPSTDANEWPRYEGSRRATMILASNITVIDDLMAEERKQIEPLLKYMLNGSYVNLDYNVPSVRSYIFKGLLALTGVGLLAMGVYNLLKRDR